MWQRFNLAGKRCILYAQWEAERCGTRFVCSEHLLLGICKEALTPPDRHLESFAETPTISGTKPASNKLASNKPTSLAERLRRLLALPPPPPVTNLSLLGLNWTLVREETLRRAPRGMGAGGDMQLSPRAKRIIDLAYDEARGMSQPNILPQHLLIGILRERDGVGAQALTRIGITLTTLRQWVQEPQSGVLLRSSALPEEAHEELLRPVEQDQNDPNSQTLLRPQQENQS